MLQIQKRILLLLFSQEIPHRTFLFKAHTSSFLMAGKKAVISHDHRQPYGFRQLQRDDIEVIHSLHIVGKENGPACA